MRSTSKIRPPIKNLPPVKIATKATTSLPAVKPRRGRPPKKKQPEPIVLRFGLERETTNTWRFHELDSEGEAVPIGMAIVGTIYVKKAVMPEPIQEIEVTIMAVVG